MAKSSLASRDLEEIASIVARRRASPIVLQKFIDVPIRVTDEVRPVVDVRGVDGGQDAVVLVPVVVVVVLEAEGAAVAGPGGNCIKIGLPGKLILSKRKGLLEVLFS